VPKRAAAGVSVHTGWVVIVVAGGTLLEAPRVAVRRRAQVLAEAERFLFHAAAELPMSKAEPMIAARTARARATAREALEDSVKAALGGGRRR
jgi:hypothetical protein